MSGSQILRAWELLDRAPLPEIKFTENHCQTSGVSTIHLEMNLGGMLYEATLETDVFSSAIKLAKHDLLMKALKAAARYWLGSEKLSDTERWILIDRFTKKHWNTMWAESPQPEG